MINILRLKLIFKSIRKQKFKFKVLLFQFIIVFFSLNLCFSLLIRANNFKDKLERLNGIENVAMITINKSYDQNIIEKLNENLDIIKHTQGIKAVSRYLKSEVSINGKNTKGIFLDSSAMDIYNFNIEGSKKIFTKTSNTKILVSEDLKNKYKINDIVDINYFKDNFKAEVIGYLSKDNSFWSNKIGTDNSLEKIENSIIIPFDKNGYYNKNIEYKMFSKIIVKLDEPNDINTLEEIKDKKIIDNYTSINEFAEQIKMQNSQVIFLLGVFGILIGILAIIGFVGVVISYLSFRNKEYAIRLTIGSTIKELSILICGEIGVSIAIAFVISAIISTSVNIVLKVKPYYISLVSLIPSIFLSIFIFCIFLFVHILYIKRKTINSLMRGN